MPDPTPSPEKIVVVVGSKLEPGRAMNAVAHALLGLGSTIPDAAILDFRTSDDDGFLASKLPLVVLRARPGHLRRLRTDVRSAGLPCVAFHEEMTTGTWQEQVARSAARSADDVELFAVATIGPAAEIDPLTRRCSLY